MIRRSVVLGSLIAIATPTIVASAATSKSAIKIISFSAPAPTSGRNALNKLKATAKIKVNKDTSYRYLNTYGSGTNSSNPRQCVELIKRYAALLGFVNFAGKVDKTDKFIGNATLGNGNAAAKGFATASNGGFNFVSNGASSLPKPGSVISVEPWTTSGGTSIPGHVGIVIDYAAPSASSTSISLKIFEQNMPLDYWKVVVFTKSGGKWSGTMPNSGKKPKVVGWANPAG